MFKKYFWLFFTAILILGFVLRIIPPQNHNFYFTTDQANDAVHIREILNGHLLFKGPETSMPGVFAGPLWYYFVAIGYALFGGDPFGGVFMVVVLSTLTTGYIIYELRREIGERWALFIGLLLQGFWFFYDFSRYAFNPFPLGLLSVLYIFLTIRFLQKSKKHYFLSLILIFLMFNCAVAAAVVFLGFHFLVGVWGVYKKILTLKTFLLTTIVLPIIFTSPILLQLTKQLQKSSFINEQIGGDRGFFSGFSFVEMVNRFSEIFARSIVPQSLLASTVIFLVVLYLFWKKTKKGFETNFVVLTLSLFAFSFVFFSSNKIWREWHTIYLYPLIFISLFLMLSRLKPRIAIPIIAIVMIVQLLVFKDRYVEYLRKSDDVSILANQMQVLDWIYAHNDQDGFNAYTFSPQDFDYPQQYLFYWYGKKQYGFVPCEYSLIPGFMKYNYVPNSLSYATPTLGCDNLRFLIIEPEGDQTKFEKWNKEMDVKVRNGANLVDSIMVGRVKIEKWRVIPRTK